MISGKHTGIYINLTVKYALKTCNNFLPKSYLTLQVVFFSDLTTHEERFPLIVFIPEKFVNTTPVA